MSPPTYGRCRTYGVDDDEDEEKDEDAPLTLARVDGVGGVAVFHLLSFSFSSRRPGDCEIRIYRIASGMILSPPATTAWLVLVVHANVGTRYPLQPRPTFRRLLEEFHCLCLCDVSDVQNSII
ncbi:hypothetical protein AWENTII_004537 [Aspergillus wentii]